MKYYEYIWSISVDKFTDFSLVRIIIIYLVSSLQLENRNSVYLHSTNNPCTLCTKLSWLDNRKSCEVCVQRNFAKLFGTAWRSCSKLNFWIKQILLSSRIRYLKLKDDGLCVQTVRTLYADNLKLYALW